MEDLNRIKQIMNIKEGMKVRTSPIPTNGLLKVIEYTVNELENVVNFKDISPDDDFLNKVLKNLKLIGIENNFESADYIYSFLKENFSLLDGGNYNHEDYMIPQKKMFSWEGVEEYTAYHQDTWSGKEEGYSKEFLENAFDSGEYDISNGKSETEDMLDVFDVRTYLDRITEIPMNERIERENTTIIEELKKINSII